MTERRMFTKKITRKERKTMSRDKQIEEMAKDVHEATMLASRILMEETKAFVKENHRYHSKNDFDIAHEKSMQELEAEYLISKGYRKASDVAREIFEEIEEGVKAAVSALQFENNPIHRNVKHTTYSSLLRFIESVKKKYIGEDINVLAKESEDTE